MPPTDGAAPGRGPCGRGAFRAKMQSQQAQQIYRRPVAEFPNAWIKARMGLRQFRLRGLLNVTMQPIWVCLTCNLQPCIRLLQI